ncbi:CBS domain-containing protein [Marininema mesophilum]|uniref:CBS domain-containing protein n=1 Tax=Marininema mesophilum TaxID=1048340 RepID=A0A1H2R3U4_9BACL|nr:CBS domain-containing protein [Marininema mesophilum]
MKGEGPITGEQIAEKLSLTRATLRPDLAILTMSGFLDARPRVGYFYAGKSSNQLLGDYIRKLTVKEHKSIPVVCQEDTTVYDAMCTMFLEDVGTLFVVREGGLLIGVVSRKDFLKSLMGSRELAQTPIGVIMTRMPNIVTCKLDDTLLEAAALLIRYQVDALPVVKESSSEKGVEVVGRITKTTVTKAFVELGEGTPV